MHTCCHDNCWTWKMANLTFLSVLAFHLPSFSPSPLYSHFGLGIGKILLVWLGRPAAWCDKAVVLCSWTTNTECCADCVALRVCVCMYLCVCLVIFRMGEGMYMFLSVYCCCVIPVNSTSYCAYGLQRIYWRRRQGDTHTWYECMTIALTVFLLWYVLKMENILL